MSGVQEIETGDQKFLIRRSEVFTIFQEIKSFNKLFDLLITVVFRRSKDQKIKTKTRERQVNAMETRSVTRGDLTEIGRSTRAKKSFSCDASKVWNKAPDKIRTAKTLTTAEKAIREHCKSLPI